MLIPLHPSFINEDGKLISLKHRMIGRDVTLEPITHDELESSGIGYFVFKDRDGWRFKVHGPYNNNEVELSDQDVVQFAQKLYSVYCAFYYAGGYISEMNMSFAEQKWSMRLPLWALNKTVWVFYKASLYLGYEPKVNTRYMENFKKRKIGYR